MAFPNVIVECAFDNDVNEYRYAQSGYSEITPWVRAISGDLRGRRYEMDNVETGSIRLTLDNSDGRFTPRSEQSPYYPFVKPARRLRVRGENMQRSQIATAGSTERSTKGFRRATENVSAAPTNPVLVSSSGRRSRTNLALPADLVALGTATVTTGVAYGGKTWTRVVPGVANHGVRQNVELAKLANGRTYTVSADLANDGASSITVNADWCDVDNSVNGGGSWVLAPGEKRHIVFSDVRGSYTSTYRFADFVSPNVGGSGFLIKDIEIVEGDSEAPLLNSPLRTLRRENLWTNPDLVDSNADGVPDGTAAYVSGAATGTRTVEAGELTLATTSLPVGTRFGISCAVPVDPSTQPRTFTVDYGGLAGAVRLRLYADPVDLAGTIVPGTTVSGEFTDLAGGRASITITGDNRIVSLNLYIWLEPVSGAVGASSVAVSRPIVSNGTSVGEHFSGNSPSSFAADGEALDYEWTGAANSSVSLEVSHPIGAGTHHIEVTLPAGTASGYHGLVEFNVPVELGRRLAHSLSVWRVSGREPGGWLYITLYYYDIDGNELPEYNTSNYALPTLMDPAQDGTYPGDYARRFVAHTAPPNAAYCNLVVMVNPTAALTENVTYAIDGIMTATTPNVALNVGLFGDALYWYVTGTQGTVTTVDESDGAITATMAADGTDTELYTVLGGTMPGETYTAAVELRHWAAGMIDPATSLRLTADDGLTYTTVPGNIAYSEAVLTFEATSVGQKLAIQLSDGSPFPAGTVVRARFLAVKLGTESPGTYSETAAHELVPWEHPMPIFEGWIESWPARVADHTTEISVVANDRLRRIGGITLESTWREAVFADGMNLVIPFDDDPVDASGKVAQIGTWASSDQIIELPLQATRGDLGSSGYVLGVDGPTDETAIEMNPGGNEQGYFLPVPYSKDYVAPTAPPPPPPAPKPPSSSPTYTVKEYVKTYYATWSRTYDGDGTTTWDDSELMYQGYYDGNRGSTRSLAGFNYKAIMADLAGATIKSCRLTLDNYETYYFGTKGSRVYVGTHNYSSKPSTWNGANVVERRTSAQHAYGANVTLELGTTIGNEFKSGAARGIAVGPAPSTDRYYYAKYKGATQAGKPFLTIRYTKKVAV